MATSNSRFMVSVDEELFQRIEDYRFENRFPTRAAAINDVLRLGLKVLEERTSKAKKHG